MLKYSCDATIILKVTGVKEVFNEAFEEGVKC